MSQHPGLRGVLETNMATEDDSDVPETGAVFTFGKSKFGDNAPNKFWIRDDHVTLVCCGDEHTALLAASGRLFTFGSNDWGQLGLGHLNTVTKPSRVKALKQEKIRHVACGRCHTIVTTESGKLYTFGANGERQCGMSTCENVPKPVCLEALEAFKFKMISAGVEHSVALTEDGDLYVWGSGSEGQLGLGHEDVDEIPPTKLDFEAQIVSVSCGYYHTAFVTEGGKLYTFGESEGGKLGLGSDPEEVFVPQEVSGIPGRVVSVSCGGSHTLVVTEDGKVYSFGDGSTGELGHGTNLLSAETPTAIMWPGKGMKVKLVACGQNHSAIVTEKGQLFTFGDGRHGKLALGEENFANQFKPTLVPRFSHFVVEEVTCGGCHMLVTAKPRAENGVRESENEGDEDSGEDQMDYSKPGDMNGTLRDSYDLSGSISARNRRREKLSDLNDTISRTLPPLDGTLSRRTLAPLGSTLPPLKGDGQNHLNKGRLTDIAPQHAPGVHSKPRAARDYTEKEREEEEEESQSADDKEKTGTKTPTPKPRPTPASRPRGPNADGDEDEEAAPAETGGRATGDTVDGAGKHSSGEEEDEGKEENRSTGKEWRADKLSEPENKEEESDSDTGEVQASKQSSADSGGGSEEDKPIPLARTMVNETQNKKPKDESETSDDEGEKEHAKKQKNKTKKKKKTKDAEEDKSSEAEEAEETKKSKKKTRKKPAAIFGKKKVDLSEEDESDEEEAHHKEKRRHKTEKKKQKKKIESSDSGENPEEKLEEKYNKANKKKDLKEKKGKKHDSESEEEDEDEEQNEALENKKNKKEKKVKEKDKDKKRKKEQEDKDQVDAVKSHTEDWKHTLSKNKVGFLTRKALEKREREAQAAGGGVDNAIDKDSVLDTAAGPGRVSDVSGSENGHSDDERNERDVKTKEDEAKKDVAEKKVTEKKKASRTCSIL